MDQNILLSVQGQVVLSAVTVWMIQRLKMAQSLPWIHQGAELLCRVISMAVAALSAAGLTFTVVGGLSTGGEITIAFPSSERMLELVVRAGFAYVGNQLFYHNYFKGRMPVTEGPGAGGMPPGGGAGGVPVGADFGRRALAGE